MKIKDFMKKHKHSSSIKAGYAFEEEIGEYLKTLGFAVEVAKPYRTMYRVHGRMVWRNVKVDLFGCVDVLAHHPDKPYFLPIQATISRGAVAAKKRAIESVKWNLEISRPQVWVKGHGEKEEKKTLNGILVTVFMLTPAGWNKMQVYIQRGVWVGVLE